MTGKGDIVSIALHLYLVLPSKSTRVGGTLGAGKRSQSAQWGFFYYFFYLGMKLICCNLVTTVLKQPACGLSWSWVSGSRVQDLGTQCVLSFFLTDYR